MPFLDTLILPLRLAQALFSIIVLGLTAHIIDLYRGPQGYGWTPDSIDFMLFTSIWTLLAVAYLVLAPSRFPAAAHKYAIIGVEAVTMIFWLAFVFTTVVAALHVKRTSRGDTAPPPQMQGV
ncbi:hypothetical protein GRF29_154g86649 [Pseudopithomyces chartarum]|uniref:MARVEL domain-containing protein n=1 Tax=Pseudopithomyces chartarum TaxID=1892770 RepID=A0AAN6RFZ6_9PLEO|nr:hypothetical protein GRF29_154g86649 [Pseudopithomyces chartarum]